MNHWKFYWKLVCKKFQKITNTFSLKVNYAHQRPFSLSFSKYNRALLSLFKCLPEICQHFRDFVEISAETAPLNVRKTLMHAAEVNRKTLMNKNEHLNDAKLNTVGFEYTRFDKAEVDRKLAKLAQVHLILEHVLLMQVNLNLDNTVCGSIMSNFPKQGVEFARLKTMKYDTREFAIMGSKIWSRIEK